MFEVLKKYKDKIDNSTILEKYKLLPKKYIVLSAHREENIDIEKNFLNLCESINEVANKFKLPIIFSTHPRTNNQIKKMNIKFDKLVLNLPPFGFFDYVNLQKNSYLVLSDSGTISEESAILGFPAVSIRTSTERPEAVDAGSIIIGGIEKNQMLNSINVCINTFEQNIENIAWEYRIDNVSNRVVKIIQGFTSIVDQIIWRK
jgi:UDP-N-acetylglucosamine 2-epimerase (non-hydrolysing)